MNLKQIKASYQNKKVFLTGHTGFKGSWLLAWLESLGAIVKGYALTPEQDLCHYYQIQGDSLCQSVIADIRDKNKLTEEILAFQPDYIFHLAAQPLVRLSYDIPIETFEVNVIGTGNVLEAVRKLKKPCSVIIITTDKVYENKEWIFPYRENDPLGGYDPYSASKAATEIIAQSFRLSFFNPRDYQQHKKSIATVRAGNVIGGGDWAKDRIVPDMMRALGKNEVIEVRNPLSIRPWQHVLEPLGAYLWLGHCLQSEPVKLADSFNFGPRVEDSVFVKNLVEEALSFWGSGTYNCPHQLNQPHEAGLLMLDCSKAWSLLQWKPLWNFKDAIRHTAAWYKNSFENPQNISQFTKNQIETYVNLSVD